MNTLLTKQQTNSKRIYGKQPGKPIVVPEHGIIIHKNHYSSQRGASTPRGIHMDLKAEMQVQDEEPKDALWVFHYDKTYRRQKSKPIHTGPQTCLGVRMTGLEILPGLISHDDIFSWCERF